MPTFYIDSHSFETATSIFTDESLSITAPSGFYSDGAIVRFLSYEGKTPKLDSREVCPSCESIPTVAIEVLDSNPDSPLNSVNDNDIIVTSTKSIFPIDAEDEFKLIVNLQGGSTIDTGYFAFNNTSEAVAAISGPLDTVGLTKIDGTPMDATNFTWTSSGFTITGLSKNSGLATATGATYSSSEGLPDPAKKAAIDIECVFKLQNGNTDSASDVLEQGDFLEYVFASCSDNAAFPDKNGATVIGNMFTSASNSNGNPVVTVDSATAAIAHNGTGVAGTHWMSDSWDVPLPTTDNLITNVFSFTFPYSGIASSSEVSWLTNLSGGTDSFSNIRMNMGDAGSNESSYDIATTVNRVGNLDNDKTNIVLSINGTTINTYPDQIWTGSGESDTYNEILDLIALYAIDTLHEIKVSFDFIVGATTIPSETKAYFVISKR